MYKLLITSLMILAAVGIAGCPSSQVPEKTQPQQTINEDTEIDKTADPSQTQTKPVPEQIPTETTEVIYIPDQIEEANEMVMDINDPNETIVPSPVSKDVFEANVTEVNRPEETLTQADTAQKPAEINLSSEDIQEPNFIKKDSADPFFEQLEMFFKTYVNERGRVDYPTLRRQRLELQNLLREFYDFDPEIYNQWTREDKIAFWINAYNLNMLNIVVENYPIESSAILRIIWGPYSTRIIDKNIGGIGKQKFYIMNEEFTLREIEERFFKKQFNEPLAFFAITRATLSSPRLLDQPYTGKKLYAQLQQQLKIFLFEQKRFFIDRQSKTVRLPTILQPNWHGGAFVSKYGTDRRFKDQNPTVRAVLNLISKYLPPEDVHFLETEIYTVEYNKYNWTLNDSSI